LQLVLSWNILDDVWAYSLSESFFKLGWEIPDDVVYAEVVGCEPGYLLLQNLGEFVHNTAKSF
jgi:hypothetical protein